MGVASCYISYLLQNFCLTEEERRDYGKWAAVEMR